MSRLRPLFLLLLIAQTRASAPPRLSGEVAATAAVVDSERVDGAAAAPLASLEASVASPTPLPTYEDDAIVAAVADAAARGNTAWVMMAAALVLMMTVPGLALLFGGLIDSGNAINTFLLALTTMGAVTVQWAVCGYSLAFGRGAFRSCGFVGDPLEHFLMTDISTDLTSWGDGAQTPVLGYFLFQMADELRRDHARRDHRRGRWSDAARGVGPLLALMDNARLLPCLLLGVGRRRMAQQGDSLAPSRPRRSLA